MFPRGPLELLCTFKAWVCRQNHDPDPLPQVTPHEAVCPTHHKQTPRDTSRSRSRRCQSVSAGPSSLHAFVPEEQRALQYPAGMPCPSLWIHLTLSETLKNNRSAGTSGSWQVTEGPAWDQVLNQELPGLGGRGGRRGTGSVCAYAPCWWNRGGLLQGVGFSCTWGCMRKWQPRCVSPRSPKKPSPRVGIKCPRSLFGEVIMWEKIMKELETLRVSPGHHASLNLSEGQRESVKWGVLDNPPPRPTYHLSSSPWKVRQSHRGILQPVSLRSGLTSLPQSVIVWELGALGAFCSDPQGPLLQHTHTHTHTHTYTHTHTHTHTHT